MSESVLFEYQYHLAMVETAQAALQQTGIRLTPQRLAACAVVGTLTRGNGSGVREGKVVHTTLTIVKTLALAFLILLGLKVGRNATALAANFSDGHFPGTVDVSAVFVVTFGAALVGSLFSSDAWNNVTVAAANVQAAQARVAASQSGISVASGGVQSAQGRLNQAQATSQIAVQRTLLDIAQHALAYTKIYAPRDGYIGEKTVEPGQTVQPGVPLLTLIPNSVFITANFKETQVGPMRPGQSVDIHVDA